MRFIDFFAGVGGFRLGLEAAGHECVGFCEADKFAVKSYRAMHNTDGEWFSDDVRRIQPGDLPDAEIYTAGLPCQSFSVAGKRGGINDARGTLFYEIMRLAQARKPQCLFFENVRGLLIDNGGKTFGIFLRVMGECGYDCQYELLNSKNYVPQNRERIFIVGYLRGFRTPEIFPLGETCGGTDDLQEQRTNTLTANGNYSTGTYVVENQQYAQGRINIIGNLNVRTNGTLDENDRVYDPDGIMGCLKATDYKNPKKIIQAVGGIYTGTRNDGRIQKNDLRIRRLLPIEYARLQGFPNDLFHKAAAVNSDSQLYRQFGNAVCPIIVEEIAKRLKPLEMED